MHRGVPVAYSFYEPGSSELTVSCLETALSLMIMGNRLFLLPKAFIPELKELLEPLPETSQLANALCAALRQNHRALSPPSSALRTVIRNAEQAAGARVLELVE
jgi:DNA-binding transcriptional LysR family regulator